jgi:hypothetical protein
MRCTEVARRRAGPYHGYVHTGEIYVSGLGATDQLGLTKRRAVDLCRVATCLCRMS